MTGCFEVSSSKVPDWAFSVNLERKTLFYSFGSFWGGDFGARSCFSSVSSIELSLTG